jgi:hypothetical protein
MPGSLYEFANLVESRRTNRETVPKTGTTVIRTLENDLSHETARILHPDDRSLNEKSRLSSSFLPIDRLLACWVSAQNTCGVVACHNGGSAFFDLAIQMTTTDVQRFCSRVDSNLPRERSSPARPLRDVC